MSFFLVVILPIAHQYIALIDVNGKKKKVSMLLSYPHFSTILAFYPCAFVFAFCELDLGMLF